MFSNKCFKGINIFCFKDFIVWVMWCVDNDDMCFVCNDIGYGLLINFVIWCM